VFKKNKFWISDDDKGWVQECFRWLIQIYGYPHSKTQTVLFTKDFFPLTFTSKEINLDFLITDFSNLFGIDREKISFKVDEDIRDTIDTPYEIQGRTNDCEFIIEKSGETIHYKVLIAKSLLKHTGQLLLHLDHNFIKIRLIESKIEYDTGDDDDLFVFLAGIFLGHGVILYRNLIDIGTSSDNFWEKKWKYVSIMPIPVMAYALALYYNLIEDENPAWKNNLSVDLTKQFENAFEYIKKDPNVLFNRQELEAKKLLYDTYNRGDKNDFDGAIMGYQKILFITNDSSLKSDANNGIGYNYLRMEEYVRSIPYFQKALEINPSYGYANDNLGFAFIMSGDLESGKFYLNAALKTENNDAGYSYRNFALYHQKRKEYKKAEEYFLKAFNNIVLPIDLLEYFYAQFLFEIGENEKGMDFLKKAVEKQEPEAIKLMEHLNQNVK
jgi:tetratricopeptide (TPR) repeat protein